jgi:hypothetical protein
MPPDIKPGDWEEAREAILAYGKARKEFCQAQSRLRASGLLSGNDNKVGVAGEFWAKQFYEQQGYELASIEVSNNEGFDFRCRQAGKEIKVSVKVISDESKSGRQMPLKTKGRWDELFVLLLTDQLRPYRCGRVPRKEFERARTSGAIGSKPKVSRSWLGKKGWISQYGKVEDWR